MTTEQWDTKAKLLLKKLLVESSIGYRELAQRLRAAGLRETEDTVNAKINRGKFPVSYLLAIMSVLGRRTITLDDDKPS